MKVRLVYFLKQHLCLRVYIISICCIYVGIYFVVRCLRDCSLFNQISMSVVSTMVVVIVLCDALMWLVVVAARLVQLIISATATTNVLVHQNHSIMARSIQVRCYYV